MLPYPHIDPVALKLGPVAIHWYGLLYLVAFAGCYVLILLKKQLSRLQLDDLIFYCALGVIIGGRLGYALFYGMEFWKQDPLFVFKIWKGGMSFHGGLLGVVLAIAYFAQKNQKSILWVGDIVAPVVPFGLAMGRLGNFINGELWGRVSDAPWAMVFPNAGSVPRHPSSLYEFLLEGVLLYLVLAVYAGYARRVGQISGMFLVGYGLCRIVAECFRQPDEQLGFLLGGHITMGQLLSVPMVLIGLYFVFRKSPYRSV